MIVAPSCSQTDDGYGTTVDADRVRNLDDRDVEIIQFVLESHSSDPNDRIYFLTLTPMSEWDEVGNWSDPPQVLIDFASSTGNKYRPASGAFLKEDSVLERGTNRKSWMRWITIKRWISDTEVEIEDGVWCCPMGGGVSTIIYEKVDGKWKWKSKGNGENWVSWIEQRTIHSTQVAGRSILTLETFDAATRSMPPLSQRETSECEIITHF